jgi:hypothetical protein
MAIECKWSARDFNPANLLTARAYPKATLLAPTPDARPASPEITAAAKYDSAPSTVSPHASPASEPEGSHA